MELNSYWKEKVVHKAVSVLLIFFISFPAPAQTRSNIQPITLTEDGARFHLVIEKLSRITGLHFIYSSNKVEVNKRVYVKAYRKTLDQVLSILAGQMNVSFRRLEGYVIIKPLTVAVPSKGAPNFLAGSPVLIPEPDRVIPEQSLFTYAPPGSRILEPKAPSLSQLSSRYQQRKLPVFQLYFDSALLRNVSPDELQKTNINNRHTGLFVSAGLSINDFSAGAEIQAGIRSVYLIVRPASLKDNSFHGAYGLGTSMLLGHDLSFNPAYLYSSVSRQETFYTVLPRGAEVKHELHVSSRQHQIKFLFQYSFTDNVNLRVGPTFNYMKSSYDIKDDGIVNIRHKTPRAITPPASMAGSGYTYMPVSVESDVIMISRPVYLDPFRAWIGWEATVSYKINFSANR